MRTSNRLVWTVIFVIGLTLQPAFGQSTGNEQRQALEEFGIYPYPSEEEVNDSIFSSDGFVVEPLGADDIKQDFSNIEDLTWLEPIAKEHRVVLVGENHYYQYTQHLRNRILFALNTFDSYSTLILERQYSKTPFLNHYLSLPDEEEARQFLQQIHEFFLDTSEVQLLHHLRRWNRMHPDKKIRVGCSDIEHDYSLTFQQILRPYCLHLKRLYVMNGEHFPGCVTFVFHKLEQLFKTRSIHSSEDLNMAFQPLENVLILAKKRGFVGEYPFLTPEYIETVIENLKSTYGAKNFDFHTYRQQAIIRNLTDVRYLGNPFSTGKVMIHGGGHHTPTHYPYPEGQNFLREGSYLTYEFPLTKGRTYSLEIKGFAFSAILPVKSINLMECCTHLGSAYRKIV